MTKAEEGWLKGYRAATHFVQEALDSRDLSTQRAQITGALKGYAFLATRTPTLREWGLGGLAAIVDAG